MLCVVQDAFSSLEGVLSHVITRLSTSLLYEKEDTDLLAVRHNIVYTNYPPSKSEGYRFGIVRPGVTNLLGLYLRDYYRFEQETSRVYRSHRGQVHC